MKPLEGIKILVTRSQPQAAGLSELLQQQGAIVYEVPAIKIVPNQEGLAELRAKLGHSEDYEWLLLTSVNSVQLLQESGMHWTKFRIACIGKATAEKVQEYGGSVDLIPPQYRAESLSKELRNKNVRGKKILLPRAAGSRQILPDELRQEGSIVEEIHIYKAELEEESKSKLEELLKSQTIDYLTFTSSSTVRNFAELAGEIPWQTIPAACIGPITAQTLREFGVEPAIEAEEFTMEGLVQAILLKRKTN